MRLIVLSAATLLLTVGLVAFAPAGAAVESCTSVLNKPLYEPDCQHLLCWGRSYDPRYQHERCTLSEEDIPDCGPGCELP